MPDAEAVAFEEEVDAVAAMSIVHEHELEDRAGKVMVVDAEVGKEKQR